MDIDYGVKKNIRLLAEAKNKKISELKACVLKRSRHDHIVNELNEMKFDDFLNKFYKNLPTVNSEEAIEFIEK